MLREDIGLVLQPDMPLVRPAERVLADKLPRQTMSPSWRAATYGRRFIIPRRHWQ
jgi:hypothetical protein